ncbi:MAG: hypothetical protein AAB520_00975 [Patescibacteria group bacterium]
MSEGNQGGIEEGVPAGFTGPDRRREDLPDNVIQFRKRFAGPPEEDTSPQNTAPEQEGTDRPSSPMERLKGFLERTGLMPNTDKRSSGQGF